MQNIEITPDQLQKLIVGDNNAILLDVRTYKEVKIATIGGINIPLHELPWRVNELEQKSHVIIYCHHGVRSVTALGILQSHGFNHVQHLKGGINAWSDIIDPTIKKY